MAKFKIEHEKPVCIGCGACAAVCPDYWEMEEGGEEGKAHIKGAKHADLEVIETDDLGCNMDAAESCPVNCIHIYENGKKKI